MMTTKRQPIKRAYRADVQQLSPGAICKFSTARGRWIIIDQRAKIIGTDPDSAHDAWKAAYNAIFNQKP